jgi:hypothetical protein
VIEDRRDFSVLDYGKLLRLVHPQQQQAREAVMAKLKFGPYAINTDDIESSESGLMRNSSGELERGVKVVTKSGRVYTALGGDTERIKRSLDKCGF